MSYHPTQAASLGCACRGCGKGALGDTVDPTQVRAVGAPIGTDPALYLRAHLNRYTAAQGAPLQLQVATAPLPLTTSIDDATANRAVWVLEWRAAAANKNFGDLASKTLVATIGNAWVNPVRYVTTNLPAVIDVVRLYGDANGLAPAKGVPQVSSGGMSTEKIAIVAGGALAIYFLFVKKRRR